jgi:hypothetical protein
VSGESLTQPALDAVIAQAQAEGFEVVRASYSVLLLDLDTPAAVAQFDRVLPIVQEHFGVLGMERWRSKSGNTHISVTLSAAQPWAVRYALEAALGSDGLRSALALLQMINGCNEASILFRPKQLAEAA